MGHGNRHRWQKKLAWPPGEVQPGSTGEDKQAPDHSDRPSSSCAEADDLDALAISPPEDRQGEWGTDLDADLVHAILVHLVAESGTVEHLYAAALDRVSTMWNAASGDDVLWRALFLRRWGEGGQSMLESLETRMMAC